MSAGRLLTRFGLTRAGGSGGVVQYIGATSGNPTGFSAQVNVPAGAQAGDTLVAIVLPNNINTDTEGFDDLAGFTLVDFSAAESFGNPSRGQGIIWRTLPASPPASYPVTITTSIQKRVQSILLRGCDPVSPVADWSVQNQLAAAGTAITTPAITVPGGAVVIASSRQGTASTITLDAALASIASSSSSPTNVTFHCGREESATPGSRTFTNTHSGTAQSKVMHALAFR